MADALGSFVGVYLMVAFLPGIVANILVVQLTAFKQRTTYFFTMNALILGLVSYGLYGFFVWLRSAVKDWPGTTPHLSVLAILNGQEAGLDLSEIGVTLLLAIAVGILAAYAVNHQVLHRLARKVGITKGIGGLNIWSQTFNRGVEEPTDTVWARARNSQTGLFYDGWIQYFSDGSETKELVLRDVIVFNSDSGAVVETSPATYLHINDDDWVIDFPEVTATDHKTRYDDTTTKEEE